MKLYSTKEAAQILSVETAPTCANQNVDAELNALLLKKIKADVFEEFLATNEGLTVEEFRAKKKQEIEEFKQREENYRRNQIADKAESLKDKIAELEREITAPEYETDLAVKDELQAEIDSLKADLAKLIADNPDVFNQPAQIVSANHDERRPMNKQDFSAMPKEFTDAPRWFEVNENKKPRNPGWNNPDNLFRYTDLHGSAGFNCNGHGQGDDYTLLDFDHILGAGKVNLDATAILDDFSARNIYVEYSISGTGAHVFIKPTPGKFGKITNKDGVGVYWFDKPNNAKLEIFHNTAGRYCVLTGSKRGEGARIPAGEEADEILAALLDKIHKQFQAATPPKATATQSKAPMAKEICAAPEYDDYRVKHMFDSVPIRDLQGTDWLVVMTACVNRGMSYEEFDALNQGGEHYNEAENRRRWNSIKIGGDWIGALHNIAKKYGYREADTLKDWRQLYPQKPAQVKKRGSKGMDSGKSKALTDEQKKILFKGDDTDNDFADRMEYLFGDRIKFLVEQDNWYLLERNEFGGSVWKNFGEKKHCLYPYTRRLADTLLANVTQIPAEIDGFKVVKKKVQGKMKFTLKEPDNADSAALKQADEKLEGLIEEHNEQIALGLKLKVAAKASSSIEALKGVTSILIKAADLNHNINLVNCLNGVVDLESGKFYQSHEELKYLPTNQIKACYDPRADCSFVEKFFAQILPDPETCAAVKRYLGYALTGDKRYHKAQFWKGDGANGKSTLLDFLMAMFNTYAIKLPNLALIQSTRPLDANAATPALASLGDDIRLALVDELMRGVRLNGELFKTILGDKTARARFLHQNLITIELRAKLILNGNHLPQFDTDDQAIIRRISRVEYPVRFDEKTADPLLPHKLATQENLNALFKILVDEAFLFYREGLIESAAMAEEKRKYIAENDFIADFIEERLIIGEGGQTLRKTLEEKLCSVYPAETRPFKKKELFDLLRRKLEDKGAIYTKDRVKNNIFENVKLVDAE